METTRSTYEAPAIRDRRAIIGLMGGSLSECLANPNIPDDFCEP